MQDNDNKLRFWTKVVGFGTTLVGFAAAVLNLANQL